MWLCVLLLFVSSIYCHDDLKNNTVWLSNEHLLTSLGKIYENLPNSIILDSQQLPKRTFGIIAELVLLYVTSNHTGPLDTVNKLVKILPEPADVIGADPRKDLDSLQALIAQPMNDIKRACKPDTSSMECVDNLHFYQQQQTVKCSKYENHQKLRDFAENIAADPDFQKLLSEAIKHSEQGVDELAVAFFVDSFYTHDKLYKKFRKAYSSSVGINYPCGKAGPYDS